MRCAKCGKEIKEGTKFCRYCGAMLEENLSSVIEDSPKEENKISSLQKEMVIKPTKGKKVVIGILAGVIVLIAGFFIGGGVWCNSREKAIADAIVDYNIMDYTQQKDKILSNYKKYNFLDMAHKISSIKSLTNIWKAVKVANTDLEEQKKSFDKLNAEKESYDLAESYESYTDSLNEWDSALKNREYKKATNAASEAQKRLDQITKDNKIYVQDKLDLYASAEWDKADPDKKKIYENDVKKINALLDDGKYKDMKPLFEEMDSITSMCNEQVKQNEGPEDVVEQYIKGFALAMTEGDFSYISDYLKPGSEIYKSQKKYIEKDISESLESYEIEDVDYKDEKHCVVTTRETVSVQKWDQPSKLVTQRCKYAVVCTGGKWMMTKFADSIKIISETEEQ